LFCNLTVSPLSNTKYIIEMLTQTAHSELTDKEIVEKVIAGQGRYYEHLMRKYNPRLYRVARSMMADEHAIEELMQCTYIKAYEHLARFEWRSSFATWITKILVNECLAHLKKKKRFIVDHIDEELKPFDRPASGTPVSAILNKELASVLEDALLGIQEKYRTVFVLREIEELSIAETAEVLDLTESNVKVRLNRAKTMLQQKLNNYYRNDAVFSFHLVRCDRVVNAVFATLGI